MISLRKLDVFVQVAQQGQITRVAESLGLTQSAVSMALSSLENLHGGPLFHRQGRRLLLNEQGRHLLPVAQRLVLDMDNFRRMLEDGHEQPTGHLCVGASTTIGNYVLPLLVADFTRSYPQATIQLQVGNTEQIERAVHDGQLDVGLIEGPCHLATLDCRFWRDDELAVVVAPQHPWAESARVDRSMLLTGQWIMRESGSGTREVFEAALGSDGPSLASFVELGHTEAIKKAVQAGLGVSCLSRLAVQTELEQGWLVAVETPLDLRRQLSLLISPERYQGTLLHSWLALLDNAP
nr:LysR substrate-binding domain-containing protein [uncultured Desulfuromonas sp.]